jgi:hypothetical protein
VRSELSTAVVLMSTADDLPFRRRKLDRLQTIDIYVNDRLCSI